MKVDGQGMGGFVEGEGLLILSPDGAGTKIAYSGDAQVGGVLANVGQRLIQAAARQLVNHFFQQFAKQVLPPPVGPTPPAQPVESPAQDSVPPPKAEDSTPRRDGGDASPPWRANRGNLLLGPMPPQKSIKKMCGRLLIHDCRPCFELLWQIVEPPVGSGGKP